MYRAQNIHAKRRLIGWVLEECPTFLTYACIWVVLQFRKSKSLRVGKGIRFDRVGL